MSYGTIDFATRPYRLVKICGAVAGAIGLLLFGYLIQEADTLLVILAILAVIFLLGLAIIGPELATWVVMFCLYINLGGIATQVYEVPFVVAGSFGLLLVLPLANHLLLQQQTLIFDPVFKLMLAFLAIVLISSLSAEDESLALRWITDFVLEGLLLYLLVINVVRSLDVLKRVLWVLILAGGLLSSLSVYQEITLDYGNEFGGLAERSVQYWTGKDEHLAQDSFLKTRTKVGTTNRAQGPLDDPNRYAQNLLMLVPLGFFIFWQARASRTIRIVAGLAVTLIISGVLLTYSRGAFITIIMSLGIFSLMRHVSIHRMLLTCVGFITLSLIVAPGYFVRMQSLLGIEGLVSESASNRPDSVTLKRATIMHAALNVFRDHPVLGVGPGQFSEFYSLEYMRDPDVALKKIDKTRRGHSLYVELAAETGALGLCVFITIVASVMRRLLQARRRWLDRCQELSQLATSFFFAIVTFLGTAVFLQLSYQRYVWLLLALSGAAIRILYSANPYREVNKAV